MYPEPVRELRDLLNTYLEPEKVATILNAYERGAQAHQGQTRKSGEDYILHPVAVARILAGMRMDHHTIAAAILHDTIEDTAMTFADLEHEFGPEVAKLVDGVTKLDKMKFRTRQEADAESFRKLMLAMSRDLRVIFIKLADRLHNMRTIGAMSATSRARISAETLAIYAPIAERLGMHGLKTELEDLGFAHRYPNRHRVIARRRKSGAGQRQKALGAVVEQVRKRLSEAGIPARVEGREKTLYSIYRKMRDKHLSYDEILDVYAIRVVTQAEPHCYQALGIAHSMFPPKPFSFKDYIALPKANGYQSLHTVLNVDRDLPVEFQIRTEEMDTVAEKGAAAHWLYKAGPPDETAAVRAREWLLKLVDTQSHTRDSVEFMNSAKAELFPDEVFVFTPRGKLIDLKAESTALDFAYAIHTDIGNHAHRAQVNHETVPLDTRLENGQTVRIVTDENSEPQAQWLEFVVTSKARAAIRHHLKNLQQEDSIALGHRLLDQALARRGVALEQISERRITRFLKKHRLQRLEELLEQIARGELLASVAALKLLPIGRRKAEDASLGDTLTIAGTEGSAITYSPCCHPIPGDRIAGYVSPGMGIVIHRVTCPNLRKLDREHPERSLRVNWEPLIKGHFQVALKLLVDNQPGVLAAVSSAIGQAGANIERVEQYDTAGHTATLLFTLTVAGRIHLARVMRQLRRNPDVLRVARE